MPNITITEQEVENLASFDVTENSVLIPMLWLRNVSFKYETDSEGMPVRDSEGKLIYIKDSAGNFTFDYSGDVPSAIEYSSVSDFYNDVSSHTIQLGDATNSNADRSYLMAYTLLQNKLNVILKPIAIDQVYPGEDLDEPQTIYYIDEATYLKKLKDALNDGAFNEFKDKNKWNIKFITTGGYSNIETMNTNEVQDQMWTIIANLADTRGDAVALIEFYRDLALDNANPTASDASIIEEVSKLAVTQQNAAAFIPWCYHQSIPGSSFTLTVMPACFSYLMAYANSVKTNANWFSASGVIRGEIPTLKYPVYDIGESLMHILQRDTSVSINNGTPQLLPTVINPIMDAGTYGYRIWGNRVCKPTNQNLDHKFIDFLNVRILLCDIKKQVYNAAMRTMFEPNDDIAWFNFKHMSEDLLEKMKTGRGILWYKWTKIKSTAKATIDAQLTIRPIEAVENINVSIYMTDEEVTVTETKDAGSEI